MEESAIREGFNNLKDGREYDNLYNSALCRAKADWIIGINATRLFTSLYRKHLNIGRVQTPYPCYDSRTGQQNFNVQERKILYR